MSSPIKLNDESLGRTIAKPRLLWILIPSIIVILFGLGVHGYQNAAPERNDNTDGDGLGQSADDGALPLAPEVTAPPYAQYDETSPPPVAQAEEEDAGSELDLEREVEIQVALDVDSGNYGGPVLPTGVDGNRPLALVTSPTGTTANPGERGKLDFLNAYYERRRDSEKYVSGGKSLDESEQNAAEDVAAPQDNASEDAAALTAATQEAIRSLQQPPTLPEIQPPEVLAYNAQNAQAARREFLSQQQGGIYNSSPPHLAVSPFVIRQGTLVKIILENSANSDLPGFLTGFMSEDLYDSVTQNVLLVPRGSRFVLEYNSDIRPGQERLQLVARRLLLPDYTSVLLDGAIVHDDRGRVGLGEPEITVDNHIGNLVVGGLVAGGIRYGTERLADAVSDNASSLATGLGQTTQSATDVYLRQRLNRQPTLKAKAGTTALVIFSRDLILPPYRHSKL